ncbi:MAG TPA: hypothetical protein VFA43_00060 [Gemmatimonadaceae bacterium]|nr:hypothetical protein [Gemmatimonadaceae bacterium]
MAILASLLCAIQLVAQGPARPPWGVVSTPDSALRLRLPRGYRKRDGCWTHEGRNYWGRGYRDICVHIEPSEQVSGVYLQAILGTHFSVNGVCKADCTTYENVRSDTISVAGRQVVAEHGLASGGINGMVRQRTLLVIIPFADKRSAVLDGETGDDAGYDELLAIARTVRESTTP